GTQLALPLELPAAPSLRQLGRWQRLIADYATSGVAGGGHARGGLRRGGTINLSVGKAVYERHRHLARAEPLLLARGRLERSEGVVNVIVRELAPLESYLAPDAEGPADTAAHASVHPLRPDDAAGTADEVPDERDPAEIGSSMRAVAPPVTSFAMGR